METLKIIFVIILCLPLLYFGLMFILGLLDNAVANSESAERRKKRRNGRRR